MEELTTLSPEAISQYNDYIQKSKPEGHGKQYSFEKLGIEDWSIVELNADDVLTLQSFVESSQTVAPAYIFWKCCGRHVILEGVASEAIEREGDIPEEAKIWVNGILESEFNKEDVERKIRNGEIDPPLLFYPMDRNEELLLDKGLLKVGNILDGNHRLQEVARYLLECTEEEREDFRMTAFLGKVDTLKYATINAQYFAKPTIKKARSFVEKLIGKEETEKIDEEHFMTFWERWYLLLQRTGYFKKKNSKSVS